MLSPSATPSAGRGTVTAGHLLDHRPGALASLHSQFNLHDQLRFANLTPLSTPETTGLGGGAGVYAFMVGVGTYEQSITSASLLANLSCASSLCAIRAKNRLLLTAGKAAGEPYDCHL